MIVRCHCSLRWFAVNPSRNRRNTLSIQCPYCETSYYKLAKDDFFRSGDGDRIFLHSQTDVYVVVVHQESQNFYTLNRSYGLNPKTEIGYEDIVNQCIRFAVETEHAHKQASFDRPAWSNALPNNEFSSFWLY